MGKKVSIIVITYNGEGDIEAFLETYRAYTNPQGSAAGFSTELIVVDNASSDKTIDIVREREPSATVLQNTSNRGFAGGARQGMEYAIEQGAEYVAIVNQDLRFSERWIEPLIGFLDTREQCAAVQPRIMMYPETTVINSYGNAQHYLGFGFTLGYRKEACHSERREESRGRYLEKSGTITIVRDDSRIYPCENGKELATCSGCATLFRASALSKVGFIDDTFFMYYEDSDLSWRLRLAGYTLALCCESTVYHRYEFSRSIQKFYYMERNRLILIFSNYSLRALLFIAPMLVVMEAGMLGYSIVGTLIRKKNALTVKEKLRSYAYFFRLSTLRYLAAKRRASQKIRTVHDRGILTLFVSAIDFQDIDNPILRRIVNPLTTLYWTWIKKIL